MSFKHLLGPTGGLFYHWTASRNARARWRPFRSQVRDWLSDWHRQWPSGIQELVVFGPSAGWTLPMKDLEALPRLTFVEPDPFARFLLRKRFASQLQKPESEKSIEILSDPKLLPWFSDEVGAFEQFVDSRPQAAFLFSNVLGQIALLLSHSQAASRLQPAQDEFLNALEGRVWASYHDLYSTQSTHPPHLTTTAIPSFKGSEASTRISEIALATFPKAKALTDHETSWLSVGRRTEFALWPLSRKQTHLIGFVKQV